MKTSIFKSCLALIFVGVAASVNSGAAPINLTLVNDTLFGSPGDILELRGSLTNTGFDSIWINGAGLTVSGFAPTDSDLSPFILNATGLLAPGASRGPFPLVDITAPKLMSPGQYSGVLTIQGGGNPNADGPVGSGNLNIVITPEPGTLLLMAIALVMLCFLQKRSRAPVATLGNPCGNIQSAARPIHL